ncbi:MAG: nicotinate-nucleotide adenylyltransferase [Desulfobacteraceae bacterium]|nr:nicotinate-nucleotide adenylyltransferase [Desulfobacteraceae bacterium]
MRIGLFGGAFDPIHFGHLRSAEEVREALALDEIWLIPTAHPPHKDARDMAPFGHRLAMTEMAVKGMRHFRAIPIEAERQGLSYSIDTLVELKKGHPGAEFYFILGSDAFIWITSWKDYRDIAGLASIVVMGRPHDNWDDMRNVVARAFDGYKEERQGVFISSKGLAIYLQQVTHLDISSTWIRRLVSMGRSVRFLTPEAVIKYMEDNGLYRGFVQELAWRILENKGENVVILDLRGLSDFTDYFVIAHGRSTRHVHGMADKVQEAFSLKGVRPLSVEGQTDSKWILMDYGGVVAHLFYEPLRGFYDLEGLWSQAPKTCLNGPDGEVTEDDEEI